MQKKKSALQAVFYILFFLLLCFLAFFPSWHRIQTTPPGLTYMVDNGLMADYYFYLSIIKQGRTRWEYRNQYTTGPNLIDKAHIVYILLGKAANITGLSDIGIYWASMAFLLFLFYGGSLMIIHETIPKPLRSLALVLIFLTGPLPPYRIALFGKTLWDGPAWWTQLNISTRLTYAPHHFTGIAFMVLASACFIKFISKRKLRWAVLCALCVALINIFYIIPNLVFITAVFCFLTGNYTGPMVYRIKKGDALSTIVVRLLHSPRCVGVFIIFCSFLISSFYIFPIASPATNFGHAVTVWEYAISRLEIYPNLFSILIFCLGVIPFLALAGILSLIKRGVSIHLFPICLFIIPFIFYWASVFGVLPISKFRFVHSALFVSGGILAVYGYMAVISVSGIKIVQRIAAVVAACLITGNVATTVWYYWIPLIQRSYNYYNNLYLSQSVIEALTYLKNNSPPFSNVLSTFFTGMYIPVFTDNIVYIGHEVSTLDFQKKSFRAERFFHGEMTESEVKQLVEDGGITYIYWENQTMLPPRYAPLFTALFSNSEITIYKIRG